MISISIDSDANRFGIYVVENALLNGFGIASELIYIIIPGYDTLCLPKHEAKMLHFKCTKI